MNKNFGNDEKTEENDDVKQEEQWKKELKIFLTDTTNNGELITILKTSCTKSSLNVFLVFKHKHLSNNQVAGIVAYAIENCPTLKKLDLSNRWRTDTSIRLTKLPNYLNNLKSLEWLYLDYNYLITLNVSELKELKYLSLYFNSLRLLNVSGLKHLTGFDLMHASSLESLNIKETPELKEIYIDAKPKSYSKSIVKILNKWNEESKNTLRDFFSNKKVIELIPYD